MGDIADPSDDIDYSKGISISTGESFTFIKKKRKLEEEDTEKRDKKKSKLEQPTTPTVFEAARTEPTETTQPITYVQFKDYPQTNGDDATTARINVTKDIQLAYEIVTKLFETSTNTNADIQLLFHQTVVNTFDILTRFCIQVPAELRKLLEQVLDRNAGSDALMINRLLEATTIWLQQLHKDFMNKTIELDTLRAPEMSSQVPAQGSLFILPPTLKFFGSYPAAIREARMTGKWLLISVQDESFASLELNRDIWRNDMVQTLISVDYIFWVVDSKSVEGELFCQVYRCSTCPLVAIVDPSTTKMVKQWSKFTKVQAIDELQHFLDSNSFEASLEEPLGPSEHERNYIKLSEEEQIEVALKRSIQEEQLNMVTQDEEKQPPAFESDFLGVTDTYTTSREPNDLVTLQILISSRYHQVTIRKNTPTVMLYALVRKIIASEFNKDPVNVQPFVIATQENLVVENSVVKKIIEYNVSVPLKMLRG
jgi:hypothetical protein